MSVVNDLRKEIDRLTFDLQQACQEKVQAAGYGLAVLEEKQQLQDKYDELQVQLESTKTELDKSKEQVALMKAKNEELAQKVTHKQGTIVEESSIRESAFAVKISNLQIEIKKLKKSEQNLKQEIDLSKQQYTKLHKDFEHLSEKKDQFQHEVKELKVKENRFNDEYNMLEEENTVLQKSISRLKQTLVEFEGLKVENKSLLDEIDSLQLQHHVATNARDQFEKQLHEALNAVKEQREKNTHSQKEINELKQQAISQKCDILYRKNESIGGAEGHPLVRQIEQEYKTNHPSPCPSVVEDLLKELQFGEVRDLEEQLRIVREEKENLAQQLNKKAIMDIEEEGDEYTINNQLKELSDMKDSFKSRETGYQMEIKRLTDELDEMKKLLLTVENETNALKESSKDKSKQSSDELLQLKSKLRDSDNMVKSLQNNIKLLNEDQNETHATLKIKQDELKLILNQLIKMYVNVCRFNKEQPKDVVSTSSINESNESLSSQSSKLISHITKQVQTLQFAFEQALSLFKSGGKGEHTNQTENILIENTHLKEQMSKLQSLITTKREQISTLRTVLKANKSTYEVALANLKSRYENDKAIQTESIGQLKKQIKSLNSECQTFSSLRSMFASRCEEYEGQLSEKQELILAAEEEKRTLNQLLKQSIHQKVALTQRLEEFEIARERLRQFTKKNVKPVGASSPGTSIKPSSLKGLQKPITRL